MSGHDARLPFTSAPAVCDLVACLAIWWGEPTRRVITSIARRAIRLIVTPKPATPQAVRPAPLPTQHRPLPWDAGEDHHGPLDGDATALVRRPYLLTHPARTRAHGTSREVTRR